MRRPSRGFREIQIGRHEVGGAFPDHEGGGRRMTGGLCWDDGVVGHPQVVHTVNPQTRIDHSEPVCPHPAGANGMIEGVGMGAEEGVGLDPARYDFFPQPKPLQSRPPDDRTNTVDRYDAPSARICNSIATACRTITRQHRPSNGFSPALEDEAAFEPRCGR